MEDSGEIGTGVAGGVRFGKLRQGFAVKGAGDLPLLPVERTRRRGEAGRQCFRESKRGQGVLRLRGGLRLVAVRAAPGIKGPGGKRGT